MKQLRKITKTENIKDKVKEATSNKQWGPTGGQMAEIANASFNFADFTIIMRTIWKRLNDHGKNWRHIYKSLLVLDYLIKNGSAQVINDARVHIPNIQTLTTYTHVDTKNDKDVGESVRERSRAIIELLNDEERLRSERNKAKQTRGKFGDHVSSDGVSYSGKRDDYRGGGLDDLDDPDRPRRSRRTYQEDGGSGESDEELPKPEPLPLEWLDAAQEQHNSKRDVARKHSRDGNRRAPKAPSESGSSSSHDSDDQPPDLRDKATKLREMFPEITLEGAAVVLSENNYSISEAALRLSDPKTQARYGIRPSEPQRQPQQQQQQYPQQQQQQQYPQQQQQQQYPQQQQRQPAQTSQPSLFDIWDMNVATAGPTNQRPQTTVPSQGGTGYGGTPSNWNFQQQGGGSSSSLPTTAAPNGFGTSLQQAQPFQQLQQQQILLEQQRQQLLYQQWLLQQQQQGVQLGQQQQPASQPTLGGMVLSGGIPLSGGLQQQQQQQQQDKKPDPFAGLVVLPSSPTQQRPAAPTLSSYVNAGTSQQSPFFPSSSSNQFGVPPSSPPSSYAQPVGSNPFFA